MISFIPMEGNLAHIKLLGDTFERLETGAPAPEHIDAMAALTFVASKDIHSRRKACVIPTGGRR
jgi:hypothetical protein